jgi:hypothetical protein
MIMFLEIIREPDTQYVLTDQNATFECDTTGIDAHWDINNMPLTFSFPDTKQDYEDRGVIFKEAISQHYHNLTMIIPASLDFNNTEIICAVYAIGFSFINSRSVHLIVFDTLRKIKLGFNPPSFSNLNPQM